MLYDLIIINQKIDISVLKNQINERTKILCLQPSFAAELEESGINYENSIHFFGAEGHKNTLLLSTEVVEKIRPFLKHLCHDKFCRTFEINWIFNFRFHLHCWISIIHIIHKAVEKHQPDRLVIFGSRPDELIQKNEDRPCFLNVLVKHYGEAHGIKTKFIKHKINRKGSCIDF